MDVKDVLLMKTLYY